MTTKNSIKVTLNNTVRNHSYDISISAEWIGLTNTVKAKGESVSTIFNNLKNGTYSIYVVGRCTHASGQTLCENNKTSSVTIKLPKGNSKIRVNVTGRLLNPNIWTSFKFLATRCGLERDIVVPTHPGPKNTIVGTKTIIVPCGEWTVECLDNLLVSPDVTQTSFIRPNETQTFQFIFSLIM